MGAWHKQCRAGKQADERCNFQSQKRASSRACDRAAASYRWLLRITGEMPIGTAPHQELFRGSLLEARASAVRDRTRCGTALLPAPQLPDAAQLQQISKPKPAAHMQAKSSSPEAQSNTGTSRPPCPATPRASQLLAPFRSGVFHFSGSKPATAHRRHSLRTQAEQTAVQAASAAKWPGGGAQVIIADGPLENQSCISEV